MGFSMKSMLRKDVAVSRYSCRLVKAYATALRNIPSGPWSIALGPGRSSFSFDLSRSDQVEVHFELAALDEEADTPVAAAVKVVLLVEAAVSELLVVV